MKQTSLLKQPSRIAALSALTALSFCAQLTHPAQERVAAQEPEQQEDQVAPLMLPIIHRFKSHRGYGYKPHSQPSSYQYSSYHQYIKQADGTYRHFSRLNRMKEWQQIEPTAYRLEKDYNEKTGVINTRFISIETGKAEPAPGYEKPYPYVVRVLPEIYFDEFWKYEKQADNTYKQFNWVDGQWVEEQGIICWCNRVCEADGTLIRTKFMHDRVSNRKAGGAKAVSFCAQLTHAAQERAAAQEPEQQEDQAAPLMLPIRHSPGHSYYAHGNTLPSEYIYGCSSQWKYVKQPDDTYRHFSRSNPTEQWLETEPTAYRMEETYNNKTGYFYQQFVSIEQGKAEPAPEYEKPHRYVVQLLPQTYINEFRKYEKQADNRYKEFSWSQKSQEWVETKGMVCAFERVCEKDGTLIETYFKWSRKPEIPEDEGAREEEEAKEEFGQAMEYPEFVEFSQLQESNH